MVRFAALLVAASVLAVSLPVAADGIPREKRPVVIKKVKKKKIVRKKIVTERKVIVETNEASPPAIIAAPPSLPPPMPVYEWAPGYWAWNAPMNTHVWVPGMYIAPSSPAEEQNLALWRIGKWIGIGRED
jgi:hypothetical protein